jgi:hypothetical protein
VVVGGNTSSTEYSLDESRLQVLKAANVTIAVMARDVIQLTRRGQESGTNTRLRTMKTEVGTGTKNMDRVDGGCLDAG